MPDTELTIKPRSGFVVGQLLPLGVTDQKVLSSLYLPLIGATALALYETLLDFQTTNGELSQRYVHSELLATLSIDLPALVGARRKLEATGLLQTYFQTDDLGDVYLYLPKAPVAPANFFADDLLSILLLDTIGEQRYQRVVGQYQLKSLNLAHAKEVSAAFLDVFSISEEHVINQPAVVAGSREAVPVTPKTTAPAVKNTQFDWQLLGELLKTDYVDLDQLAGARDLIVTESQVYGLNEIEMANLIASVTSVATGKFDASQLKLEAARRYQRRSVPKTPVTANSEQSKQPAVASSKHASTAEEALLSAAKYYAPYNFLDTIKQQKHSFSTDGEHRLVRDLVGRVSFNTAVVNILIYYLLESRSTLNKNLMETVADDWQQHQLTTPEAALQYIKQRQAPKSKGRQNRSSGRTNRNTHQEKLPNWVEAQKKGEKLTNQQQLNAADEARLNARIAKETQNSDKEG